jgi:ribonuclease Z
LELAGQGKRDEHSSNRSGWNGIPAVGILVGLMEKVMLGKGLSQLKLTFLGTSAAQPTATRNVSGLAVKADSDLLLFDCGEGSQRQMVRFGTGFSVDAVFFTHFHADHYLGIIGFLRTMGMLGRTSSLTLYGPAPAKRLLEKAVFLGVEELAFPVDIVELADGETVKREGYEVRAVQVDHRISAIGYVLREYDRPGAFDAAKAKALGLPPGPDFRKLQFGESVKAPDGRTIEPKDVIGPTRSGRKVIISGDTRPCDSLREAARDADVLVHESTFSDAEQERAQETRHSTAREAATIAREAVAHRLVLTHFSSRFERDTDQLLAEAREAFSGPIDLAYDGFVLDVPVRH